MKKYTIVYGEWWNSGSHRHSITRFEHVETNDIAELLNQDKYGSSVWFVFDGWCEQTKG